MANNTYGTEAGKVAFLSLGCKVNAYDTEAMRALFVERGYKAVDFDEPADIYVINTCTVTNISDKKSRQMIRKARKLNPRAIVAACGCYAQVSPEEVKNLEGVSLVLGTANRSSIVDAVESLTAGNPEGASVGDSRVRDIMGDRTYENLTVNHMRDKTRAYVKIEDGCDNFCAYCIVPYARGPVKSRRPEDVMSEVRTLAANGYKEIVVTGIHVTSYGKDLDMDLMGLLKELHGTEGIMRIRLGSIEPGFVTESFLMALDGLPKICGHFHLSLQSGCDKTLARMNRQYTSTSYRKSVLGLRQSRPGCGITTDIIVGFPGETDSDFEESRAFAEEMGFAKIHVFPYSPKKGTPAASFPGQIESRIKDERCRELIELSRRMEQDFRRQFLGRELEVLFEKKGPDGLYQGHSGNYIDIRVQSDEDLVNEIRTVKIVSISSYALGEVAGPTR